MTKYIVRRLLLMIPVLLCVSFVVYFLMDLAPGSIIDQVAPADATPEQIEQLKEEYGLNGNIFQRYGRYLGNLLHGDMGRSFSLKRPVIDVFMERLPRTLELSFAAIFIALLISIPLGIAAATHHRSWIDGSSVVLSMISVSMPPFWLGLLLIFVFANHWKIFPSGGSTGLLALVLPAITLGTEQAGNLTRITRSSMLDVIRQDYLRTARAKGVSEKKVIRKHALRNALIPIINVLGSTLGNAFGGAVAIETVFAWNGIGRLTVSAINMRDMTLATGCILMFTLMLNLTLLIVDIAYAYVDPRVKARYSS